MRSAEPRRSSLELLTPHIPLPEPGDKVAELPINSIIPNRRQVRTVFSEDKIQDLANSIKEHGLQSPLIVRPIAKSPTVGLLEEGGVAYELIAGERRWRALKKLGRKTAPAIVRQVDDSRMRVLALVENVQREDLGVLEKANSMIALKAEYGSVEKVADIIHKSRSYAFLFTRIGELDEQFRELIGKYNLTVDGADALASILHDVEKLDNPKLVFRIRGLLLQKPLDEKFLKGIQQQYFSKGERKSKGKSRPLHLRGKTFWKSKKEVGLDLRVSIGDMSDSTLRTTLIKETKRFFETLGAKKIEITF